MNMNAISTNAIAVEITVRSLSVVYGKIRLIPQIRNSESGFEVRGFVFKSQGEEYSSDDLSLARAMPRKAIDDIVFETWEVDETVRSPHHVVFLEIPDWNESVEIKMRAVETEFLENHLLIEMLDDTEWRPLSDMFLVDAVGDSFMHLLESVAIDATNDFSM